MFNAIVTAIAICAFAASDQDINFATKNQNTKSLIDFFMPQIYKDTRNHDIFTFKKFIGWMLLSLA
jgi:hypothetical protein